VTTVLKLGGSVVTDKTSPETVDHDSLDQATAAISEGADQLIVVHGGGSFGHYHASEHGMTTTAGTQDATGVTDVHDAMRRLNDAVVSALQAAGVNAVPVHPFSIAHRDSNATLHLPVDSLQTMLGEGFVPVLHGDVVSHLDHGATILSGDELVASLVKSLAATRVGLCSDVPGVLDDGGSVIERIEHIEEVASFLGGSEATDVTGGMTTKVRELLALEAPAYVFDIDGLAEFLHGNPAGTCID